jgi:tRNA(fMet)-specific endonuclease VapC
VILSYLLDTNVVSEISRPSPNANVEARLRTHGSSCALSAVSLEESIFGIAILAQSIRKRQLELWIEAMVTRFTILPFDRVCAEWLGRERARLRRDGYIPQRPDAQIAATAVCNNLILVTRNTRDFAHFTGLRVENWFAG